MKNKSFTLIELLVVIVIIGILAGVIIVSVSSSINKANFAKAQSFSNTVQNELLGDLVSEWTFDIASNPGEDTWGNNDGTVSGATYKTKADGVCVYGGCYEFDGTDSYIDCGNSDSLNFGNNDFSISFWIKATPQTSTKGIVGKRTGNWSAINPGFEIRGGIDNHIDVVFADGVNHLYVGVINNAQNNEWNYITYSFDRSSNLLGYLNGENVSSDDISSVSQSISNTKLWDIGRTQNSSIYAFDGLIDDVRIYNAALFSSQIKQQYVAGLDSLLASDVISKEEYDERLNNLAYAE